MWRRGRSLKLPFYRGEPAAITTIVVNLRLMSLTYDVSRSKSKSMKKQPSVPQPTEAELDVLRVLWKLGPSTVKEVFDVLRPTKAVGYTTVLKQLQVMHRKGLVRRSERFRAHVYEPNQSQEQTRQGLARTLLRQAFDGSARSLLQSVLAGRRVTPQEVAEIRRLLDEVEGGDQ
jgi:BlaI family transcriptional regulator, penicillinase repressor